jgi:nucleoside-diphosphate-sugar epimerase
MTAKRILVTGARGGFGPWVVDELLTNAYRVVAADRRPLDGVTPSGVEPRRFALYDRRKLAEALEGCSGVVHLAAYPSPKGHPPEVIFRNNTGATVSVLEAAAHAGVATAVIASSISIFGLTYAPRKLSPRYVPVDEDHPLDLLDPYALSKAVDEMTALSLHRRTGITVIALRFHWIVAQGQAKAAAEALRENPDDAATNATANLWGYVDARDAARAVRLALEHPEIGFAALNITAADTLASGPTTDLVTRYHPSTEIRRGVRGFRSAWSFARARRLLGYEPRHSWRHDREGSSA